MSPVIGLDVSKRESDVQAFLDKGKQYGKSYSKYLLVHQLLLLLI